MNNSITKLASISFLGRALSRGAQYLISVLIAQGLGASALGAFAIALVILELSSAAARFGLDTAVLKFIPEYLDAGDQRKLTGSVVLCLCTPLVIGSLVASVLFVARSHVTSILNTDITPVFVPLLIGIPLYAMYYVGEAATRGFKETKYEAYIRGFGQGGSAILLVGLSIYIFNDIEAVMIAFVASICVAIGLALYYLWKLDAFDSLSSPTVPFRRVYRYAVPVSLVAVAGPVVNWSDVLMLGIFLPGGPVGEYQAAFQSALLLQFPLVGVNAIFPSIASDLYQSGRHDRLRRTYTVVNKWIITLTLFSGGFMIIFSSNILAIFGATFKTAQTALVILVIGRIIATTVGPAGYLLSMADHERLEMINTVVLATLNITLNYILIPPLGIIGAAIATSSSMSLLNIVRLLEVRVLFDIWPYSLENSSPAVPLLAALGVMLFGTMLPLASLVQATVTGIVSFAVFAVCAVRFTYDETDQLLFESV